MPGLKENLVAISAYDPQWPGLFAREQARLAGALGPLATAIEHIGSTAVEGFPAKPIIDIAITTESFARLPSLVGVMEGAGYRHKGEFGLPGRHFFTRGDPVLYHVHVVERQSALWRQWLGFRDALRNDAALRRDYSRLKRKLAEKFPKDRPAYTAAKGDFIRGRTGP